MLLLKDDIEYRWEIFSASSRRLEMEGRKERSAPVEPKEEKPEQTGYLLLELEGNKKGICLFFLHRKDANGLLGSQSRR